MKLNEFIHQLNLRILNEQQIQIIIPIIKNNDYLGECEIGYENNKDSEDAKKNNIIFDASEDSFYDKSFYEKYDIHPMAEPEDISDEVFMFTSEDNYRYVTESVNNQIYVVIN